MSAPRSVVIVCRNITPPLRRVLSLFLIEIAPLTFVGKMSTRVKDKLWEELQTDFPDYEISMIVFNAKNENGFVIEENVQMKNRNTYEMDGVILGTRRTPEKQTWEKVLGKSIPFEYPLIRHLLDTAACADTIIEEVLSTQQLEILKKDLKVDSINELKKFITFIAGMHDIGKAHPEWQYNTLNLSSDHHSLNNFLTIPEEINKDAEKWRHDINSGVFFNLNTSIENKHIKSLFSEISASHHGNFETFDVVSDHTLYPIDSKWLNVQKNIENTILEVLNIDKNFFEHYVYGRKDNFVKSKILITGIVVLADWVASSSNFMEITEEQNSYEEYYEDARNKADQYLYSLGVSKPMWKKNLQWNDIFPNISQPNDFQQSMIDKQDLFKTNGLTLINAPMGIGKTEASLYLAAINGSSTENSGIWVNLPTQATANALFDRAVDIHDKVFSSKENSVALLHSNASLNEAMEKQIHKNYKKYTNDILQNQNISIDDSDSNSPENNKSSVFVSDFLVEQKTGGMSSIAISTIDQLIISALPLKHNMLRWLAISGKTIILDEIHDFDSYTFSIIKKFVAWAGSLELNIILMSASLSETSQKELLEAYAGMDKKQIDGVIPSDGIPSPSWVHVKKNNLKREILSYKSEYIEPQKYVNYTLNFEYVQTPLTKIQDIIQNNPNANTLVVAHTVDQAISFYREIKEKYNGEVILLHSRMTERQKQKVLAKILKYSGKPGENTHRKAHVLVSTQIVQQSMDIDYDVMVSILSPMPEFLQRIGRVYRHDQGENRESKYNNNPQIYIIVDECIKNFINDKETNKVPKSSVTPYKMWDVMMTYATLQKYTKECNIQNVKKDIAALFAMYYKTEKFYKNDEKYQNIYQKAIQEDIDKGNYGDDKSVSEPWKYRMNISGLNLTRSYTQKSHKAAETRLIDETYTVVFVKINNDGNVKIVRRVDDNGYLDTIDYPLTMRLARKEIGLSSVTVNQSFYEKNLSDASVILDEKIVGNVQDFTTFVDITKLENVKFDSVEGLTKIDLKAGQSLWI